MSHPFEFRPGTQDESIFRGLMERDEYRLPPEFGPEDIVVDVGVHIGTICYLALCRGAGRIYGFEAEPSNYACAARNLRPFGDRVRLRNVAVWRADVPADRLYLDTPADATNTGGGCLFWNRQGPSVPAVAFDEAMSEITDNGRRRVRMLKIDCEGSEFPILLTAKTLHMIDYIAGEFHEFGGDHDSQVIPEHAQVPGHDRFTMEGLAEALRRAGFAVAYERQGDSNLGLFYADRAPRSATLGGRLKTLWHHLGHRSRGRQSAAAASTTTRTTR